MEPVGHLALLKAFFREYVSKEVSGIHSLCWEWNVRHDDG